MIHVPSHRLYYLLSYSNDIELELYIRIMKVLKPASINDKKDKCCEAIKNNVKTTSVLGAAIHDINVLVMNCIQDGQLDSIETETIKSKLIELKLNLNNTIQEWVNKL